MKKLLTLTITGLLISGITYADVNSNAAIKTFKAEIQNIKSGLQSKKLSPIEAQVLLSAIQARENEVIIEQNAEMIQNQKTMIQKLGAKS